MSKSLSLSSKKSLSETSVQVLVAERPRSLLNEFFSREARLWIKVVRSSLLCLAGLMGSDKLVPLVLDGRPLTRGEEKDLRVLFKDSIDYSKIRIHTSPLMTARLILSNSAAEAWGPLIGIRQEEHRPDFSKESDTLSRFIFRHEMTHAWQKESCFPLMRLEALGNSFRRFALKQGDLAVYEYKIERGKDLADYSMEQQANIIADYAALREGGTAIMAREAADIIAYENVLGNFLKDPSYAKARFCKQ